MTGLAALCSRKNNPRAGSYNHIYLNHQILAHEKLSSPNPVPREGLESDSVGSGFLGHPDSSCCWSLWRGGKGCSVQAEGGISWSPCEQPPFEGGAGLRHLTSLSGKPRSLCQASFTLLPCWRMAVPSLSTGQPTGQGGPLHAAPLSASGQQAAVLCQG